METFSALLAICAGNSPVPVNSPHKGQWRGALMFSLIYAWINDWVNNREAGDLRRQRGHYDVIVMCTWEDIVQINNNNLLELQEPLIHYNTNPACQGRLNIVVDEEIRLPSLSLITQSQNYPYPVHKTRVNWKVQQSQI